MTLHDNLPESLTRRVAEDRRRHLLALALRRDEFSSATLAAEVDQLAGPGEGRLALLVRLAQVVSGPWPRGVEGYARRATEVDALLAALVPDPPRRVDGITVDRIPVLPALSRPAGSQPSHVRVIDDGRPGVAR